jgi:outer membrane protein assembly factor BamB
MDAKSLRVFLLSTLAVAILSAGVAAADWPQWGGRDGRNFASDEKGIPDSFSLAVPKDEKKGIEGSPEKNIKWKVKLGSQTYGNPTVSNGRLFIGTNDASLNDPRLKKTGGGLVMCLEEATGKLLWQLPIPRMKTKDSNFNFDQLNLGVCSSPTVDGDRVYLVTNRCEVLCLDVQGQANGNDGPFMDEGQYMAGSGDLPTKPGRFDKKDAPTPPPAVTVGPTDGDIVWRFDILAEVDSWPQDAADCSVVVLGDYVYVCTSNGVDKSHHVRPSPNCPDLIVLDKKTGELVAVSDPPIGNGIFHGDWSSPSHEKVNGKDLIFWGGGDGVCYAFGPVPVPGENGKKPTIRSVWKFDCNPPQNKFKDGKPLPYNKNHEGPSEIIGTPVFYKNRIYLTVGQDSQHGNGPGCLSCIDATKTGDITESGKIWQYYKIQRSFSTVSIADGLLFVADYAGIVHCLDAETGAANWTHDLGAHVWGSTFAVDGKVLIGDEKGKVTVFAVGKEKKILGEAHFDVPVYATPIAANGVLYVATQTYLYAIQAPKP